jgi:hypothetical protein
MSESCAPPALILPPRSDRLPVIRKAFRLEWLTIGWMTVEAVVAIAAGVTDVCVIKMDREELGRTQEARCCAHLSLAHFWFKRPTDLV